MLWKSSKYYNERLESLFRGQFGLCYHESPFHITIQVLLQSKSCSSWIKVLFVLRWKLCSYCDESSARVAMKVMFTLQNRVEHSSHVHVAQSHWKSCSCCCPVQVAASLNPLMFLTGLVQAVINISYPFTERLPTMSAWWKTEHNPRGPSCTSSQLRMLGKVIRQGQLSTPPGSDFPQTTQQAGLKYVWGRTRIKSILETLSLDWTRRYFQSLQTLLTQRHVCTPISLPGTCKMLTLLEIRQITVG